MSPGADGPSSTTKGWAEGGSSLLLHPGAAWGAGTNLPAQVQGKRRRRREGNVSAGSPGSAETGGLSLEISEPAVVDADAVRLNAARSAHSPGRS